MKHTKMHRSLQCLFVTVGLVAFASANAKPAPANKVGAGAPNGCNVTDVTTEYYWNASDDNNVGSIGNIIPGTDPVLGYNSPLSATACIGPYGGNPSEKKGELGTSTIIGESRNVGEYGDGLFNGGDTSGANVIFDDGAFISDDTGLEEIDLDGNGTKDGPGWIFIGKINNGSSFEPASVLGDSNVIGDDFFSVSGNTWRIQPGNAPFLAADLFAQNGITNVGFFDAFAITIKQGPEFTSHLFTAETLGLADEIFTQNVFNFEGTFRTPSMTGDGTGWSNITLWIHDPEVQETTEVPAPGILGLMGIGLLGFGWSARRRLAAGNKLA